MNFRAGVASRDVTPPAGTAMSGFAARQSPATGAHDPLVVHALVVDDTALVTIDVVGLHEDDCGEIRRRCGLPEDKVVVHATHTHGGPVSMRGRLGDGVHEPWLAAVVDAAVTCVAEASVRQEPVHMTAGYGTGPGVARNRRRPGGPVDDTLPVVLLHRGDGSVLPFGCPGGDVQVQAMLQVFVGAFHFDLDLQEAVNAPRFATWSFPNSFAPFEYLPGRLSLEARFGDDVIAELERRGHRIQRWPEFTRDAAAVEAILLDRASGFLHAAADPRQPASAYVS